MFFFFFCDYKENTNILICDNNLVPGYQNDINKPNQRRKIYFFNLGKIAFTSVDTMKFAMK